MTARRLWPCSSSGGPPASPPCRWFTVKALRLHALDLAVDHRDVLDALADREVVGVAQLVAGDDDAVALAVREELGAAERLLAGSTSPMPLTATMWRPCRRSSAVDGVEHGAVERAAEVGHVDADGAGALQRQGPRHVRRAEAEFGGRAAHALRPRRPRNEPVPEITRDAVATPTPAS